MSTEKYQNKYRVPSARREGYDYRDEGWYFVTICTKDRVECFGKIEDEKMMLSRLGQSVVDCWLEIPKHFAHVRLDEFIVMPNHVHGIVEITVETQYLASQTIENDGNVHNYNKPQNENGGFDGNYFAKSKNIHNYDKSGCGGLQNSINQHAPETQDVASLHYCDENGRNIHNHHEPGCADLPDAMGQHAPETQDIASLHYCDENGRNIHNHHEPCRADLPDAMHGHAFETQDIASLRDIVNEHTSANNVQYKNKFGPQSGNVSSIIRGFKIGVTKFARNNNIPFTWQPRFYDHIIRNEKSLNNIRQYIIDNPMKWSRDRNNMINLLM